MNETRLQALTEAFQDDALSEDECQELMDWFDEDESRLARFADELRIGNVLAAMYLSESDVIHSAVCGSLRQAGLMDDVSRQVRQRIESRSDDSSRSANHPIASLPRSRRVWIVMSALAASLVFVAYLASLFDADSDSPTVVANIQNARDVQGIAAGDPLITGQILNTPQGAVKINFQSGAKLTFEGPAELEILGPNSARLSHGVATVRVPGKIKGFVLVTPHERVTDLGTSFGVDVDRRQRTSISVFEGEVELASRKRVVAGEAVVMESSEQILRSVPYTIDRFLDTWQVSFGLQSLVGDIRVATPEERRAPGQVEDTNSLLLIPERESVVLREGFWVDASAPGTYRRPFRKRAVQLEEDVRVDSFLLQYNPVRNADVPGDMSTSCVS